MSLVTQWLGAGDRLKATGTRVAAFAGASTLGELVQRTGIRNLAFVPSAR